MQQTLEDFYKVVRAAGVNISPSDSIETSRMVPLVGFRNRSILRSAFQVSLAKSLPEQDIVGECFDQFFRFKAFDTIEQLGHEQKNSPSANADEAIPVPGDEYKGDQPLAKMLLDRDATALSTEMKKAAREVGLTDIWFFTQKSLYTQQIMQKMGLRDLQNEIATAAGKGDCPEGQGLAEALRQGKDYLAEQVRDFVEQQLSMYGKNAARNLREEHLQSAKLSNIEQRDFHIMHHLVLKMAKRLSTQYSKKKKRENRGQLDFRKTLRHNAAYGGVLFETFWKTKQIDKPRLLVMCDVSGSVQAYARFLLLFLYSLNDVMERIDSYVFTGNLVDVNDIFEDYPVEQAIDVIMERHGMGGSDYGTTLLDLEDRCMDDIDNKTTVLILGDARNNFLAPRSEVMQLLHNRAKRVIWLNPEPENFWKTGDSVMYKYRPYCHLASTCNTLEHLERMLDDLLKAATGTV
ncbi:MAG TPA: VWA containing CoxE family protein [Porticoccaceae bacterium]|nr:VWA containing CoxE family protein [Porticoccaceae bacterium]HCO60164.1 VWA containing CoxE family protein [Porticoccaceae bacterium]